MLCLVILIIGCGHHDCGHNPGQDKALSYRDFTPIINKNNLYQTSSYIFSRQKDSVLMNEPGSSIEKRRWIRVGSQSWNSSFIYTTKLSRDNVREDELIQTNGDQT